MITLKNVDKYFNKGKRNEIHVINDANITLPNAGLVALLGESGSGKTTMLNAIGGLDNVKKGDIYINNERLSRRGSSAIDRIRNLKVGYIFQDYKLIDDMSVFDNVAISLKLVGIKDKQEIKERVEYVLDKVGILRYRYRPAGTLSGGERQRVGIARALVKNPEIILADEPTGNLDSKNSIEVMNIIKKISMDRLVILVTHERNLAEFYASRIVNIVDGKIVSDKENDNTNDLDYEIANTFYLKEFKNVNNYKSENHDISVYDDKKTNLNIKLIVKNGNIYIKSENCEKIEVIDDNSSIEVIDDFEKKIDKSDIENYDFDMSKVGNQTLKKKYSSIFNPLTAISSGFRKVFGFSTLRKLLLIGFIFAGFFSIYSVGKVAAILHVVDSDFVEYNQNYLYIEKRNVGIDEYKEFINIEGVKYALPGDSKVGFNMKLDDYYQTANQTYTLSGSLASIDLVTESNLVLGRMPENEKEILIDSMLIDKMFDSTTNQNLIMAGLKDVNDVLNRKVYLSNSELGEYTIVGITTLDSPSIYAYDSEFIKMLSYTVSSGYYYDYVSYSGFGQYGENQYTDYNLYNGTFKLTKNSRLPKNDYEVLLPEGESYTYKLNKETSYEINGKKLTVVGFYENSDISGAYVSENSILYYLIEQSEGITLCTEPYNMDTIISDLNLKNYVAYSTYSSSQMKYNNDRKDNVKQTILVGAIFMIISLVEIYLMTRSSFLSRIKEIGILRAIGTKKRDIYTMFMSEIFAITTLTTLPAMLIMYKCEAYLAKELVFLGPTFYMPVILLILTILFMYAFNILVGLIPVFTTMLKTPAAILARYDVD